LVILQVASECVIAKPKAFQPKASCEKIRQMDQSKHDIACHTAVNSTQKHLLTEALCLM